LLQSSHTDKLSEKLTRSQRLRWERLIRSSASDIDKRSLRVDIPKLELGNAMQQREIALKDKEISHLEELLEMHKNSKPNPTE